MDSRVARATTFNKLQLGKRREATYECPSEVDEQQLKDLHIVCTERES